MSHSNMELGEGAGGRMQRRAEGRRWNLHRILRIVPLLLPVLLFLGAEGESQCPGMDPLIGASCNGSPSIQPWDQVKEGQFNFGYSMVDWGDGIGGTLKLSWVCPGEVASLQRYELVYTEKSGSKSSEIDKAKVNTLWSVPSRDLQLRANYDQDGKKGTASSTLLSFFSVVTPTLTLYGLSDETKPNGLAVNADYQAIGVTRAQQPGAATWFVVQNVDEKLFLVAPSQIGNGEVWGPLENRLTAVVEDLDDLSQCPNITEAAWGLTSELEVGKTYALWRTTSFGGASWNVTDRFAKLKVLAIDGNAVTIKVAVQPKPGLRWVITP